MVTSIEMKNTQNLDVQKANNDTRRSNKPIMEKRRRARINSCLNELKILILDAMKKDPARHSKLEKADILEMTVRHLEGLQRQKTIVDPTIINKFRTGFNECAGEVGRFPGLEPATRRRLLQHLAARLASFAPMSQNQNQSSQSSSIFLAAGTGLQLLPTRLPNGDIALVFPAQSQIPSLPTLIPIPTRTNSVPANSEESVSSTTSEPSDEAPLALVMKKNVCDGQHTNDKPWRPW